MAETPVDDRQEAPSGEEAVAEAGITSHDAGTADELCDSVTDLHDRYFETNEISDLNEAIKIAEKASAMTHRHHKNRPYLLQELGDLLVERYSKLGSSNDLDDAIEITREAVATYGEHYELRFEILDNLSDCIETRYDGKGEIEDLEEAVQTRRESIDLLPQDYAEKGVFWNKYGNLLKKRYERQGLIQDLNESIAWGRMAIDATSVDGQTRPYFLNDVATRLYVRFLRLGQLSELQEAIALGEECIHIAADDHEARHSWWGNQGARLLVMCDRTMEIRHLERALKLCREHPHSADWEDEAEKASHLNHLSNCLSRMYSVNGKLAELDEAIQTGREAVQLVTQDSPLWSGHIHNLGGNFIRRYKKTKAMADLEDALKLCREALEKTPDDHPNRAMWLSRLGLVRQQLWRRTHTASHIDEAVAYCHGCLDLTPGDHPARPSRLTTLSTRYKDRHKVFGDVDDLRHAMQLTQEAVDATQQDDPSWVRALHALATCFHEMHLARNDSQYIDRALDTYRRAVSAAANPDAATANREPIEYNLAKLLQDRHERTGKVEDLEEATRNFKTVLQSAKFELFERMLSGAGVLNCCARNGNWQQGYDAAVTAIELAPGLLMRSLENSDRQYILSQVAGLASEAAEAAILAGKGPARALQLLESGRGLLSASFEETRADIAELERNYPTLAERYNHLRIELDNVSALRGRDGVREEDESPWIVNTAVERRHRPGRELDALFTEIRKQKGFEQFLLAPTVEEMQAAAKEGPIVVVNVSAYRCDAILIETHQIRTVHLPLLSEDEIKEKINKGKLGTVGVLDWLWRTTAGPILDELGFLPKHDQAAGDTGEWPHIWWIPTGVLAKFPLHAAGQYRGKRLRDSVLDRTMSSYASSLKAVVYARRYSPDSPASTRFNKAVLVAMEHTTGSTSLPFAPVEINSIRSLCASLSLAATMPEANSNAILSEIKQCKVFHFAGHGYTDLNGPSRSHLCLEGDSATSVLPLPPYKMVNGSRGVPCENLSFLFSMPLRVSKLGNE